MYCAEFDVSQDLTNSYFNMCLRFNCMHGQAQLNLLTCTHFTYKSNMYIHVWRRFKMNLKQEAQRATYRAPEYNVPPFWQISQDGYFCLLISLKKNKLGRRRWDLASCQVSLNSVQRFQRRSRKCLSQSEARAAILFFRSARKTQTW